MINNSHHLGKAYSMPSPRLCLYWFVILPLTALEEKYFYLQSVVKEKLYEGKNLVCFCLLLHSQHFTLHMTHGRC